MTEDPLHLLCVAPVFPGRLGAVADWLVRRRGYRCTFLCHRCASPDFWPTSTGKGLEVATFNVGGVAREASVPWTRLLERGLCYANGAYEWLSTRRLDVDLVLGHSDGLGSTLFVPAIYRSTPIVQLFDYYVRPKQFDLADLADESTPIEYFLWRRSVGASDFLELENGVTPWTLSDWQRRLFPAEYQPDFVVRHSGVDVPQWTGDEPVTLGGRKLDAEMKIVSFVSRTLDRLRGFDRFLAVAAKVLSLRDDILFVAIGDSVVRRSLDLEWFGQQYAQAMIERSGLADSDRLWLLGPSPPGVVRDLLAATSLHLYPSRSYPVAHSVLEAAGHEAVILAWDSEAVREYFDPDVSALFVDGDALDDVAATDEAVETILTVLDDPATFSPVGKVAGEQVRQRWATDVVMPETARWFNELANGR